MSRKLMLVVCLSAALSTLSALAQQASPSTPSVAHIYVASLPANSSTTEIDAYAASASGTLTAVDGSPFQENESDLAVNSKYLFGLSGTATNIDSYAIESNGALRYVTSTDWVQNDPNGCGFAGWLFPDRSGKDLYSMVFDADCANNGYQSYRAKENSGELNYLGYVNGGAGSFDGVYLPATFLGNDKYAYEATNNGCFYYGVQSFQRDPNGLLTTGNASWTPPAPPAGYNIYIPTFAAADPTNHVAMTLWAAVPPGCSTVSQQIGSFTADAKGNLTTTNTSANMPNTLISSVMDLKVSPSGKLLAVAGQGGLQIFHFNGANPPTAYTPLLTTATVNLMFWDNDNHLYAISETSNELLVFTVTPTAFSQAAGSPYTITSPVSIAVQPKTPAIP
jgi:hypothetical protein